MELGIWPGRLCDVALCHLQHTHVRRWKLVLILLCQFRAIYFGFHGWTGVQKSNVFALISRC